MTKAQQDSKIRNWKIFRLRGAYSLLNLISLDDNYDKFKKILDEELLQLGAKTNDQLLKEYRDKILGDQSW